MIMLMQPNAPSPAPPPVNPYDFLNDAPKAKKSLLPTGNSKQQRLIVVVLGLIGLLIAGVIIAAVLNGASNAPKVELTKAAQQQQELVRVATIGTQKARGAIARNLAVTTLYTMQSDQAGFQPVLKKEKLKLDKKTLALGVNPKTDQALTSAEAANRFDEVFTETLRKQLNEYRETLKKIDEISGSRSTKAIVAEDFEHTTLLLNIK